MFGVRLPKWLYESMPYVYGVAGVIVIASLHNLAAFISGVLLISAGIIIKQQRTYYRKRIRTLQEAEKEASMHKAEAEQPIKLDWQSSYESGDSTIDRQHRRLFALANELINAVIAKKKHGDIVFQLEDIESAILEHFQDEEKLMAKHRYEGLEAHKDIHADLVSRLQQLIQKFSAAQFPANELIGFIVYDVISQHLTNEDSKFVKSGSLKPQHNH